MLTTSQAGFVRLLAQKDRMTVMIDGMKVLNRLATMHMAGNDIRGMNRIDGPGFRPWIVSRILSRPDCMRQPSALQDALNSGRAGNGQPQAFKLTLDRTGPSETIAGFGCGRP